MRDLIYRMKLRLMSYFYHFFPIKENKVVFINFNGKGYGCNPKYIAEEMIRQNLGYDMVWLVNDMEEELPAPIRKARFLGRTGLYEIATAKVIVTNVKNEMFLAKKRGQYVIQTWHGAYGPKLVEKEVIDKLPPSYIKESIKNSKQTDLFLSNSKRLTQCYRESFWCECEIMECGLPRHDILFTANKEEINQKVRECFGVSKSDKLILYAPTFRDDGSLDAYELPCEEILDALGAEWKILLRLHPNVNQNDVGYVYSERVINGSIYPDIQDILFAADILITDYSDSVFAFSFLGKPTYIFATDLEEYQKMRGMTKEYFEMPYKICETKEALIEEISKYTPEGGKEAARKYVELSGGMDDGNASKRVVQRIVDVIEKRYKW